MARKIYFTSLKGGTGVTTVCTGIGIALAQAGERTLIVDGDRISGGGLIAAGLGNMQVYTLGDYERAACRAKQAAICHPKLRNLYIMPSLGLKDISVEEKAVEEVEGLFDYVLLDKAAAGFGNEAVIVTEPYLPSVKSADNCRSLLADSGIKEISLIVNKLSGGLVMSGEVLGAEEIAEVLHLPLTAVIPEDFLIPSGKRRQSTAAAFRIAADVISGKSDGVFNILRGYTGLNGYFKRKMRAKI